MTTKVVELYGSPTSNANFNWAAKIKAQACPYLGRKCIKTRKSAPNVSIGTCTVASGKDAAPVVICPIRLRDRHQIFFDCIHLLSLHEPGNEIHAVPEISIPGGSLDFVLLSARNGKVRDFAGIELQTLDTTGTVWPERQRFLKQIGLPVAQKDARSTTSFGMNWKMTAKTILMQLHHKIQTFEHLNKHFVLVAQDHLLRYMEREFSFGHLSNPARVGDSMHFHAYELVTGKKENSLALVERQSTDMAGIATALGMKSNAKVELEAIVSALEAKMSPLTRLQIMPR